MMRSTTVPGLRILLSTALVAALVAGCSGTGAGTGLGATGGSAASGQVVAQGFAFQPSTTSVPVGGSLTFTNRDSVAHTITEGTNGRKADGARFDEGLGNTPDAKVVVTFPTAGTVRITCRIHPSMTLTVSVGGDAPSAAPSPSASFDRYSY
jgi:plastocyanin